MPLAAGADPRAYPLIDRLFSKHGYADLRAENFDAYTTRAGHALLLFAEDPMRFKETLDLAVIVPELERAFPRRFVVGVLLPEAARALHARYGFRRWPALVLLKDGRYVGAVDGLRNWDEYIDELTRLLAAPAARAPTPVIAIRRDGNNSAAGGAPRHDGKGVTS